MKLLIVDDEERTREMLRKHIAWEDIGIDEVETARNGQDALHIAGEWRPDIVLCDVRMPKMDGIEFAKRLRWTDTACKIIFLSGFSDKQYLLSAIHLKATSYIEKPINRDEVRSTVATAVQQRLEDRRKQEAELELQIGYERGLPFLKQELVRRLVAGATAAETAALLRAQRSLPYSADGPFTVIVASFHEAAVDSAQDDLASFEQITLPKVHGVPAISTSGALCGFDRQHALVVAMPGHYGSAYREARETIEQLYLQLRHIAGERTLVRVSVGEPVLGLETVAHSYRTACATANLHFYKDGCSLLFAEEAGAAGATGDTADPDISGAPRLLREALRKGDVPLARSLLEVWAAQARRRRDPNIVRVKHECFQYLLAAMEAAAGLGLTDNAGDEEQSYIWREIDRMPSLTSLESYALSFLEPFAADAGEAGAPSGKMRDILHYIHAHYHEKGFTIQTIADRVALSETYLCSYFKKQKGQTIKEYINEVRMEKAKELLRGQDLKLYDVAMRLGFADANYFTTFFKKYVGCTPSEYREKAAR